MAKPLPSTVTIGGRSLKGYDHFEVFDPATGEAFAFAPQCGELELEHAIEAALEAQPIWAKRPSQRREALSACARVIRRHRNELASLITSEQGKPIWEARNEVDYAASVFELYAGMPIPRHEFANRDRTRTVLLHRPFGIVGLITPWNFPIGTVAVKLAPALLAGNAVILKPSPVAPLSPLFLGKAFRRALPSGILNTVSGDAKLGQLIAKHPKIRKLSVTGSTQTGKSILELAATEVKSVTLELGGNDPAILLPDVDPKRVAPSILASAWRNAGQVCSAIKRVYVHETIYKQTVDALSHVMDTLKVGDGHDPHTRIGPLTTNGTLDRVIRLKRDAIDSGATWIESASSAPHRGFFVRPCIVSDLSPEHPLVQEEQFGPVLPIVGYQTIDQAIELANDTNFGLSASVWTSNPSIGFDVATQLECGRVGVNGHRRASSGAPFGGLKHSGLGRELGSWGLMEMCEPQALNIFEQEVGK